MESPPPITATEETPATVAEVEAAGQRAFDFMGRAPFEPRPAATILTQIARPAPMPVPPEPRPRQPFGEWLLGQCARRGWIGELSRAFQADRNFPKKGAPEDVRLYLRDVRAEGDAYEALDDAELDWAGL